MIKLHKTPFNAHRVYLKNATQWYMHFGPSRCNNNCIHCGERITNKRNPMWAGDPEKVMRLSDLALLVSFYIKHQPEVHFYNVTGESLLQLDRYLDFAEYLTLMCSDTQIYLELFTNGFDLNLDHAVTFQRALERYQNLHLVLHISTEGPDEIRFRGRDWKDSHKFWEFIKASRTLERYQTIIAVTYTAERSLNELESYFADLFAEQGISVYDGTIIFDTQMYFRPNEAAPEIHYNPENWKYYQNQSTHLFKNRDEQTIRQPSSKYSYQCTYCDHIAFDDCGNLYYCKSEIIPVGHLEKDEYINHYPAYLKPQCKKCKYSEQCFFAGCFTDAVELNCENEKKFFDNKGHLSW